VIGHIRSLAWIPICAALALSVAGCGGRAVASAPPPCDSSGVSDTGPSWSPDGRTIAFRRELAHGIAIFTIPSGGGRAERLTPPGRYGFLAWSPDSRQIALPVLRPSGNAQVLVVDARTRRETVVAPGDVAGGRPAFSPDGRSLVIVQSHGEHRSIGVVASGGGTVHRLTPLTGDASQPAWSPDGRRIAYVRSIGSRSRIYVLDRTGLHTHPLTSNTAAAHVSQLDPAWSPDGRSVAFVAVAGPFSAAAELARPSGGAPTRIADGGKGYDLAFAPHESSLAYVVFGQDSGSKLFVAGIAHPSTPRAIDPSGFEPSWSPDGSKLAFAHQTSGYASRLRVAAAGTGVVRRITCQPAS
jgi:TolB protein